MGARQSFQTDIDRRPRSNSTIETGIEIQNTPTRRSRYRHHPNGNSECELDEGEDLANDFSNFEISPTHLSQSASTPAQSMEVRENASASGGVASSAPLPPSRRLHHHHRASMNSSTSASAGSGLRLHSTRSSLLQALSSVTAGSSASSSALTSSSLWAECSRGCDIKCPMCNKKVISDEVEVHLVMCFTRPRIAYNEDILEVNKEECSICLDEMNAGETIARLPCLCIYHKRCIDEWFKRKNCCPEHPGDE